MACCRSPRHPVGVWCSLERLGMVIDVSLAALVGVETSNLFLVKTVLPSISFK